MDSMKFEQMLVVLPCHSFHDFPMYHTGEEADGLLACYSALWHPALIANTEKMPVWRRNDDDDQELQNRLIVLPKVCQDDAPGYWLDNAREKGGFVIEGREAGGRDEIVEAALAALGDERPDVDGELVADFLALGLAHLWTEVLTNQMRYSSMVDEDQFETLVAAAAAAAVAGDEELARQKISACFDCLAQSKDHFYAVDVFLLDLTLVADTTLGPELAAELQRDRPTNLLISGDDLATIAREHPATLAALRAALERGTLCLVGGETNADFPIGLASADMLVEHLQSVAARAYETVLGRRPKIYGRRSYGLSALLPQVLNKLGFTGALHVSLDGGRLPHTYQNMLRWEGFDGTSIGAFARVPLDAAAAATFLSLPQQMGESMDHDHVAAICFAHWPGHASPWYDDVLRITKFGTVLGKFVTFEELFENAETPGEPSKFAADEYRPPNFRRDVEAGKPDAVSGFATVVRRHESKYCAATLGMLAGLLRTDGSTVDSPGDPAQNNHGENGVDDAAKIDAAVNAFAAALPRDEQQPVQRGYLVANPYSFARTTAVETPQFEHPPAVAGAVRAAFEQDGRKQVIVEVPSLGYAWIGPDQKQTWKRPTTKPLVEENVLRNEHFEVHVHPEMGGVQSVHNRKFRGNLFSQRLAMRLPGPKPQPGEVWRPADKQARYSEMVADAVEITEDSAATASITSRGRLLGADGGLLAKFRQTVSVFRTKPILKFDVQLDPVVEPDGNPWENYYASLFAWPDDVEVARSVGLGTHVTERRRVEAPHFIDLRGPRLRTTVLTGGLANHVLTGERQLDSLLIVQSERQRSFQFGVSFGDIPAHQAALDFLAPQTIAAETVPPPAPASSWLFHVNAKNVLAVRWNAVAGGEPDRGVIVRLQETAGKSCTATLRAFRAIAGARKVDFLGQPASELQTDGDAATINFSPYEICDVELSWQS